MANLKFKTRFLNKFRRLAMLPFVERRLVRLTQNKTRQNFSAKLLPNNYQYPKNTWRTCERGGILYTLDISDYMQYCLYYGIKTEPRAKLYSLVKNSTTVIDVGTNFGETLLNFSRLNKNGVNVGFEPVPFLFEQAKRNVELNQAENVALINAALSNDNSTLLISLPNEYNSGGFFMTSAAAEGDPSRTVEAVKLDDYAAGNDVKNISLIKIDVEGFEMKVLEGAAETIKRQKPALFVEVCDSFLERQQSSARELIRFIESNGYEISYAEDGKTVTPQDDFAGKHFDIVCLPR